MGFLEVPKTKYAMFMRLAGQYAANSRMLIAHTVFITPLCGFDLLSISLLLEPVLRSGFINQRGQHRILCNPTKTKSCHVAHALI
jgi:hypothetical protein